MSTHQTPSIFSRGVRVKFDAENYGIMWYGPHTPTAGQELWSGHIVGDDIVSNDIEEFKRLWVQSGNVIMAPKVLEGFSTHHRTCHLRHGGEECTC